MKFIKFLFGAALGVVLILVGIGFLLPSRWHIERSIVISAPPENIYPLISNLKSGWPQWNAFDKADPNMQYEYAGAEVGTGSVRSWVSSKVGSGSQKIIKADPKSGIDFEMTMKNSGFVMFGSLTMVPVQEGTKVIWRDGGDMGMNPISKIMGYLMDPLMGRTIDKSLKHLKQLAEGDKD